jgi:hypothetical protein
MPVSRVVYRGNYADMSTAFLVLHARPAATTFRASEVLKLIRSSNQRSSAAYLPDLGTGKRTLAS